MKLLCRFSTLVLFLSGTALLQAQDFPYLKKVLPPINLNQGGSSTIVNLTGVFGVNNVNGPLVKYTTNAGRGALYLELYPDIAPLTVANFRRYMDEGKYNNTFIHRAENNFVIQGGGYKIEPTPYVHIPTFAPVKNEFKLSNLPGTIAMAKLGGDINSATSEWYFNLTNNSFLDSPDQKFTVFGRLLFDGLAQAKAIGSLPVLNLNTASDPNGAFTKVPYITKNEIRYLVAFYKIGGLPFLKLLPSATGYLTITALSSNSAVVRAEMTSTGLRLTTGSSTGTARITVVATDPFARKTQSSFVVTSVKPGLPVVRISRLQDAREAGNAVGKLRFTRTGSLSAKLVVNFSLTGSTATNGTDFRTVALSTTIPAGSATRDIAIVPISDSALEGVELVTGTVSGSSAYTLAPVRSASITILDDDVPNITMTLVDSALTEGSADKGLVRFTRSGPITSNQPVYLQKSGNAEFAKDYVLNPSTFFIPAGSASAALTIRALADNIKESTETIVLKASPVTTYNAPQQALTLVVRDTP